MKKGQLITYKQTNLATLHIQNELYSVGLWNEDSRLQEVTVYHCALPVFSIPDADGFFFHGESLLYKLLGYEIGHIYIPKFVISNLFNQNRGSLRAIIRHEYGHAFAHYYPDLIIDNVEFEQVFGGHYFEIVPSNMPSSSYVSDYAKTMPMEDFAETFRVYLMYKGICPIGFSKDLKRKWRFIEKAINKIN